MTTLETVEDAFLDCLEQGAEPAREFTVRLPCAAIDPRDEGKTQVLVAGYLIHVRFGKDTTWE